MGRGKAKAVCKQASSASLRDVRAGPGVRGCARPGPGANLKGASAPANTPAPHTRSRRNRGQGEGFPAARGLVAPHAPPASQGTRRRRVEGPEPRGGGGGRSSRTPRPPGPRAAARGPSRRRKASEPGTAPRLTHLEQRPPPPQHGRGGRP